MSGDNKCLKNDVLNKLENRISELEIEYNKLTYVMDNMNIKIDELKEMIKELVDDLSQVSNYKAKVDNFCDTFVSKDEFYSLKSDVDRLKERAVEGDRILQRYQWLITIIMGIITFVSLIKSFV